MLHISNLLSVHQSASLLEPDIDECPVPAHPGAGSGSSRETSSSSNGSLRHSSIAGSGHDRARGAVTQGSNLTSNFKENLQIHSATEQLSSCSSGSEEDDFLLEFKSTEDGRLEIKLTNCPQQPQNGSKESPIVTSDASKHRRSGNSGGSGTGSRSVEDMDVLEAKGNENSCLS